MEKTKLELLMEETMRPIIGAFVQMRNEIRETMGITEAPWKIFKKPYNELSDEEILALFDVYHIPGEMDTCPMCKWALRRELQEMEKGV